MASSGSGLHVMNDRRVVHGDVRSRYAMLEGKIVARLLGDI